MQRQAIRRRAPTAKRERWALLGSFKIVGAIRPETVHALARMFGIEVRITRGVCTDRFTIHTRGADRARTRLARELRS